MIYKKHMCLCPLNQSFCSIHNLKEIEERKEIENTLQQYPKKTMVKKIKTELKRNYSPEAKTKLKTYLRILNHIA